MRPFHRSQAPNWIETDDKKKLIFNISASSKGPELATSIDPVSLKVMLSIVYLSRSNPFANVNSQQKGNGNYWLGRIQIMPFKPGLLLIIILYRKCWQC